VLDLSRNRVTQPTDPEVILSVSDLSVRADHHLVLENVSFSVEKGTTLAIVGPNGAGKTTLFRVLLNSIPYTGKVEWHGEVKIGYVPQHLFAADIPITAKEFLAFKRKIDFQHSLASAGLESKDVQNRRLNVLSGGEMQRVLIAWAIVDEPNVLLFDEPTANVDIGSEELIYETLNRIEKELGMTILLISHNIHVVRTYSDNTLALDRNVIYFGESKKLSDPNILMKIYGSHTILTQHEHQRAGFS
jgi:zinc transport system ATP-binding protein